jgi:hypothetical protein
MRLPLVGGAYKGRSSNASSEEAINLFIEKNASDQSEGALVNVPGCILFCQLPVSEVRGMHFFNGKVYAVAGSNLYRVDTAGNYTDLGSIGTSSGPVAMADNAEQIAIADGGSLKLFTLSTGVISNTGSEPTRSVDYVDGYFVFTITGTQKYFWMSTFQASTLAVDPLEFDFVDGGSDDLIAVLHWRRQAFLIGTETAQLYYNSGGTSPFAKYQGGFSHVGAVAPHTVQRLGNGIVFLSRNEQGQAVPMMSTGDTAQPLTLDYPQVAYQMGQYTNIEDAFAYVYQYESHDFYVLTFPAANATWVFDLTSKHWHKRAHIINATFPNRERYNCHTYAFEKHLVGDYKDGKIYELNSDYYTMNGTIIPNQRDTVGQKEKDEDRVRCRSLQLTGEEGVSGTVILQYSKDGGHTWSYELETSFGEIGKYKHRAIWRKLGHGRDWVVRIIRKVDAKTIYTGLIAKRYGEE